MTLPLPAETELVVEHLQIHPHMLIMQVLDEFQADGPAAGMRNSLRLCCRSEDQGSVSASWALQCSLRDERQPHGQSRLLSAVDAGGLADLVPGVDHIGAEVAAVDALFGHASAEGAVV